MFSFAFSCYDAQSCVLPNQSFEMVILFYVNDGGLNGTGQLP